MLNRNLGFTPCITRAETGLRSGDNLLMVNDVPVGEHTHNQIKESIRASAAVGELSVVISRDTISFKDSIKAIEKGLRSGILVKRYEELPDRRSDLSRSTALMRENGWKNRYRDVLPYDDTRVKLTNNEYINASWIDIHGGGSYQRQWIAAQGPTERTICDFWKCVWESDTTLILMLTRCVESHVEKCAQYWPEEADFIEDHGDFDVQLVHTKEDEYCTRREIKLTKLSCGKTRTGTAQLIYIPSYLKFCNLNNFFVYAIIIFA